MRELFIEELQSVVGGGGNPLPDIKDDFNTTHACCEETPFGCCGWTDPIRELIQP